MRQWRAFLPFKIMSINEHQLARGHELSQRLLAVAADVSAWADEITAASELQVEVQRYADAVLAHLQEARVDLGTLGQLMSQAVP